MAQDREPKPESEDERIHTTADLDLITLYDSAAVDSEIEADVIVGVLEAGGIETGILTLLRLRDIRDQVSCRQFRGSDASRPVTFGFPTHAEHRPRGSRHAEGLHADRF